MELFNIPTVDNLDPSLWGKSMWEFIEAVIVMYPRDSPSVEQRDHLYHFLDNLGHLLPCAECRAHYQSFVERHSIGDALFNRATLVRFYFELRKEVADRSHENFASQSPIDLWKQMIIRFQLMTREGGVKRLPTPVASPQKLARPVRATKGCLTCRGSR